MTFARKLTVALLLALALVLVACETAAPRPPTYELPPIRTMRYAYFTFPDFVAYPTATMYGLTNTSATTFTNKRVRLACLELNVYTYFTSGPMTIEPGESRTVSLPYSGGYYMMVNAGALCSASAVYADGTVDWRWDIRKAP